ncbi:MAG: protein-L-isoaspartate(D-aspartate) O-methyltransferase [Candidatus Pacebacteria bacterium]|jgi:protein-L-isoaspartate(D-aspartate) O-methyltransferase|nr:protein-L-isoaspartate(D-aspartate) O-methyltransferase [Candidatus Paceibacterota bacterium]
MQQLIQNLIDAGYLKTPEIIRAWRKIDRADFIPDDVKKYAYENTPLPIGNGQTISQPQVVALMLELLQPKRGEKILDVGSGSGWQSALLAEIVGETGSVTAIERIPELFALGKNNLEKYNFHNIESIEGDGTALIKQAGYYDKIIVAAASDSVPEVLKSELKVGGTMIIPIKENIFVLKKIDSEHFLIKEFPGFLFVPLIRD